VKNSFLREPPIALVACAARILHEIQSTVFSTPQKIGYTIAIEVHYRRTYVVPFDVPRGQATNVFHPPLSILKIDLP
jgi:hypothetical protein